VGQPATLVVVQAAVRVQVFISHAGVDADSARWAADVLRAAGFDVELDRTDRAAGENFLQRMSEALARCQIMVALWSPTYFADSSYALRELQAAEFARIRIVPLRLVPFSPPALWAHLIYRDLFNLDDGQARSVLLDAVAGRPASARSVPSGPGGEQVVWNVTLKGARPMTLSDQREAVPTPNT
jgi:hypothetical protein